MITKRKKKSRQRGSKTHGWGAMKKHRGAGNRGGRGMAGSGKRADQMKTFIIKKYGLQNYFGKHGFKRPQHSQEKYQTINVGDLNFEKEEINLQEKGYNKLLGKGKPNKKYHIKVKYCSQKAKEKIERIGGEVSLIE
mgnify:CR=1 FL=1